MGLYTIKDIAQLTSIKPHTIRMWEKRYGILQPKRSENNNRYYCQSEVSLLSKIAYLTQNGHKIGKLAKLSRKNWLGWLRTQSTTSLMRKRKTCSSRQYSGLIQIPLATRYIVRWKQQELTKPSSACCCQLPEGSTF